MMRFGKATAFLVTLLLVQAASTARAGLLRVATTLGASESADLTDTVIFQDSMDFGNFPVPGFGSIAVRGRSSVASLGLEIFNRSAGSNASVNSSVGTSYDADVIFESDPDITTAIIGWSARIQGSVFGDVHDARFEPGWQLGAELSMNPNNPVAAQLAMTETLEFGLGTVVIGETITAFGQVPTNVPVSIFAVLNVNVFQVRNGDNLSAKFFDSMSFNPTAFFDIRTPGVTANSVPGDGDWLVNNRVTTVGEPSPVPEPSSLVLFGIGIAGLFGYRARCRRRTGTTTEQAA